MKSVLLALISLLLILCFPLLTSAEEIKDNKPTGFKNLLSSYLSTEFLNAQSCEAYRNGNEDRKKARELLLKDGKIYFRKLMVEYSTNEELGEIQKQWLYELLTRICIHNPDLDQFLVNRYPDEYNLIASCRTLTAMEHLAERASNIVSSEEAPGSFIWFIETIFDENVNFSDAIEGEAKEELTHLLSLLSIDGEHIYALYSLIRGVDEGAFYAASRIMELFEQKDVKKPILTEDYQDEAIGYLEDNLDSDALGMVLENRDRTEKVRKHLMNCDIEKISTGSVEKYHLLFTWFLKLNVKNGKFDEKVVDKYLKFLIFNKMDTLELRLLLAKACAKTDKGSINACAFLKSDERLKSSNEDELCVYPELEKIYEKN